jgi:tight adherence protein B
MNAVLAVLASGFIGSSASRLLIAALAGVAVAALTVSLTVIFGKRQAKLERRLAGYELPELAGRPTASAGDAPDTSVVQQAVAMTERFGQRTGLLAKVELMLEQADLPIRPAEAMLYVPVFSVIVLVLCLLLLPPATAIVLAAIAFASPFGYLMYRKQQRLKEFERQLPDTLTLLAGAMRAGFSFMQGLETVANESQGAMRRELQRAFTEARLGRAIEEALDETAVRMGSKDLAWAVMAIRIQREVGGNLAQLLDTVADTMTKRERLRREIKTLTAEGRFSGILVSLFAPVFGLFLFLTKRDYISLLWSESMGVICLIGAAVASVIGWFWIRKIVNIEV